MMRRILTILISLFSGITIYAQDPDVEKFGLKGNIKSVVIIVGDSVDRIGNHIIEPYDTSVVRKYNSDGNMIERSCYWEDTLEFTQVFKYNSNGNIISLSDSYPDGIVRSTEIYECDSRGNIVEKIRFDFDGEDLILHSAIKFIIEYYD